MVSKNKTYRNAMRNADKQEARTESDKVLQAVIFSIMSDNMELFKQYNDNPSFKKWLSDMVFNVTYNPKGFQHGFQEPSFLMAAEKDGEYQ
jgi:type I restriction enzyme R subunit